MNNRHDCLYLYLYYIIFFFYLDLSVVDDMLCYLDVNTWKYTENDNNIKY